MIENQDPPYRVSIERIREAQRELDHLLCEHYQLTEATYLDHPCRVDFNRWTQMEDAGEFFVVAARIEGALVGYFLWFVLPSTHMEARIGVEDAQYVDSRFRGRGIAKAMLHVAESELVRRGCSYAFISSKHFVGGPNLEQYLQREGYRPIASVHCKNLEK